MYLLWRSVLLFAVYTIYLVDFSFEANKRIMYVTFERPHQTYENPKYIKVLNISSRRPGRHDPVHYIEFCYQMFVPLDNNMWIHIKIDEFLSNEYRPTFVQFHFKLCDIQKFISYNMYRSKDISIPVTRFQPDLTNCAALLYEPGVYCWTNISVSVTKIPQSFPFEKGRMFVNLTNKNKDIWFLGYIDTELKMMPITRYKGNN